MNRKRIEKRALVTCANSALYKHCWATSRAKRQAKTRHVSVQPQLLTYLLTVQPRNVPAIPPRPLDRAEERRAHLALLPEEDVSEERDVKQVRSLPTPLPQP